MRLILFAPGRLRKSLTGTLLGMTVAGLVMTACNPSGRLGLPEWNLGLLGPLVQTSLGLNDVSEAINFSTSASFNMSSITLPACPTVPPLNTCPCPTGQITIPALPNTTLNLPALSLGPITLNSQDLESATFTSGNLTVAVTNNLPFNIKQGAVMEVRSNNAVLFTQVLDRTINANGGTYSLPAPILLAGKSVGSSFTITMTNVSTDGTGFNPPGSFGCVANSGNLGATVNIRNPKFSVVRLKQTGVSYAQTSASFQSFSLAGDEVKISNVNGDIRTNVDNGMPFRYLMQIYFYDQSKSTVLDSLFTNGPQVVEPATTDNTGVVTASVRTVLTGTINTVERYDRIRRAKFMRPILSFRAQGNAAASSLQVRDTDKIGMQLIGDLTLTVNR